MTARRSQGRQTASTHAPGDPHSSSSYTRRKVAEIRRDVRDAKVVCDAPLPHSTEAERSGREYDDVVEVARTEPCSPVVLARVMAAAGLRAESTWAVRGWSPGHEEEAPKMQDGHYGAMAWNPQYTRELSLPGSSMWPNPQSQGHHEAIPARFHAIEGLLSHSAGPQSPIPRPSPRRPQSLQMPYSSSPSSPLSVTHSAPSTASLPSSAISTSFPPPRPLVPARPISWAQYSSAPRTGHATPAYAPSPGPSIQLPQAPPSQHGYVVHYPDSNRMSSRLHICCF